LLLHLTKKTYHDHVGKTAGYCDMEMVNGTAQETDTCWFRREESDDYFWKVADSSQLANTPSTDHTCGSKTGTGMLVSLFYPDLYQWYAETGLLNNLVLALPGVSH